MSDLSFNFLIFNLAVVFLLALDLGVLHKKSKEISVREALILSLIWFLLALCFNGWIYYSQGSEKALEFLTGYLVEKSLSLDNVFVIALIFTAFQIPGQFQHRVLFWGILGALVMRAIMIFAGVALIHKFHWLIYIFGGFLVYAGLKMIVAHDMAIDRNNHPVVRLVKRVFPVTEELHEEKFFVRIEGVLWATPLFVVLLLVEFTDLVFAVDSIPAILAITDDPYIVYTSNVFAILGLRSLYFALAGMMHKFSLLKYGLALILIFVGIKMMIVDFYKIPILLSLGFIVSVILISIFLSFRKAKKEEQASGLLRR